jgi:hypothetical protein
MSIKSLFRKYIVPQEIDFMGMLQLQSLATHKIIEDLYECFINQEEQNCQSIIEDEHKTEIIKKRNMELLLNAFITPIDRESIYRSVTQLEWVAISVKHFVQETKAYKVDKLTQYKDIFHLIYNASRALNEGFEALNEPQHAKVSRRADKARGLSDEISQKYIQEMVILSQNTDFREVFIYKEILSQLKEIGKRLHIAANTLQDIVVKMD